MSAAAQVLVDVPWTLEEFIEWEDRQSERFEYVDGRVIPKSMIGASIFHKRMVVRLLISLHRLVNQRGCDVFDETVRVRSRSEAFYPDIMVICDQPGGRSSEVTRVSLIAEVLSPSTARLDRVTKLEAYQHVDGLRHYLIIDPIQITVDHHRLVDGAWVTQTLASRDDILTLDGLDATLPLAELYPEDGAFDA